MPNCLCLCYNPSNIALSLKGYNLECRGTLTNICSPLEIERQLFLVPLPSTTMLTLYMITEVAT